MNIIPISAFKDNYIWLLINKEKHTAICIDPGEADNLLRFLQNNALDLQAILLTHHHADHIGGVPQLLTHFPLAEVYAPNDNRIPTVTQPVNATSLLNIFDCQFTVLSTPGHTSSHICYYEKNLHWLFCGDTLFSAGCGRVFDGSIEQLYHSLQLLKSLPDDTHVYCAHEYTRQNMRFALQVAPTNQFIKNYYQTVHENDHCTLPSTIGLEKKINPFLRIDSPEIQDYAKKITNKSLDSLAIFTLLRAEKNQFI